MLLRVILRLCWLANHHNMCAQFPLRNVTRAQARCHHPMGSEQVPWRAPEERIRIAAADRARYSLGCQEAQGQHVCGCSGASPFGAAGRESPAGGAGPMGRPR